MTTTLTVIVAVLFSADPADDEAMSALNEHHRHHHHGGITQFVEMSLDTLGEEQSKHAQGISAEVRARIFELAAAIRLRRAITGEWLLALSGLLSIALGVLVFAFPGAGAIGIAWVLDGLEVSRRLWFMGQPLPVRQQLLRVWRTGRCRPPRTG